MLYIDYKEDRDDADDSDCNYYGKIGDKGHGFRSGPVSIKHCTTFFPPVLSSQAL